MSNRLLLCAVPGLIVALGGCVRSPSPVLAPADPTAEVLIRAVEGPGHGGSHDHYADPGWSPADAEALEAFDLALQRADERGEIVRPATAPFGAPADADAGDLLQIFLFDIGQADSMLVVGPTRRTLLIDLGEPGGGTKPPGFSSGRETVLKRVEEITGSTSIDYFVVSHYHGDHVGRGGNADQDWGTGVIGALSDFSTDFYVDTFIHIGDDGVQYMEPETGRSAYKTIKTRVPLWETYQRIGQAETPQFGVGQIDLGPGVTVDILAFAGTVPDSSSAFDKAESAGADYAAYPGNENDLSIALRISAGEFEMFTGGDMNGTDDPVNHPYYVLREFGETYTNIEDHMVAYWKSHGLESDVEVYRADHHGSQYSTTANLLEALDPEFILYSSGGQYSHPTNVVTERGASTARQFVTTAAAHEQAFRQARGEQVGEIAIVVAQDGNSYTVDGVRYEAFSSAAEASESDVGAEDRAQ